MKTEERIQQALGQLLFANLMQAQQLDELTATVSTLQNAIEKQPVKDAKPA